MDYVKEVEKFEKSPLFKKSYDNFVRFLKLSGHKYPSVQLETVLGISGVQIRKLAQHARRRGVLISSCSKGYSYASTFKDAEKTLDHLRGRASSLQVTIDAIEQSSHYKSLAKR